MLKVNTKTQLVTFFLFALLVNGWHVVVLLILMPLLLGLLIYVNNRHYFRLSYRLKWFYFVMFAIFAFNTPGEHIAIWPFNIKPTYEGVLMGLEQLLRIATMLALLSLILMQNTKQQLISGIYFLMRPLSFLGLDIKRFAARLWLTLHYVDLQQSSEEKLSMTKGLSHYLDAATDMVDEDVAIHLENTQQTQLDYLVLSVMFLLLIASFLLVS